MTPLSASTTRADAAMKLLATAASSQTTLMASREVLMVSERAQMVAQCSALRVISKLVSCDLFAQLRVEGLVHGFLALLLVMPESFGLQMNGSVFQLMDEHQVRVFVEQGHDGQLHRGICATCVVVVVRQVLGTPGDDGGHEQDSGPCEKFRLDALILGGLPNSHIHGREVSAFGTDNPGSNANAHAQGGHSTHLVWNGDLHTHPGEVQRGSGGSEQEQCGQDGHHGSPRRGFEK